jgi:protein subunit release factor B
MTERTPILSLRKKDFVVTPFKSSGPGGQNRNKNATAIRIVHSASGARAEAAEHKSQDQNRKAAWKRLQETETFRTWLRKAIADASLSASERREVEQRIIRLVERQMNPELILVEVKDEEGNWVPMPQPEEDVSDGA